jgi:hypothetical protein
VAPETSNVREERFSTNGNERRFWPRLTVNWKIRLFRADNAAPVHSTLENICSGGLLFVSSAAFAGREAMRCHIALPDDVARPLGSAAVLECDLEVLRSEPRNGYGYGIACQIKTYCVRAQCDWARTGSPQLSRR